jgi:alkyl hydroperoxide reductase subunit AhpC
MIIQGMISYPEDFIDPLCRIRCIQNYTDSTWKDLKEIKYIVEALQKSDTNNKRLRN